MLFCFSSLSTTQLTQPQHPTISIGYSAVYIKDLQLGGDLLSTEGAVGHLVAAGLTTTKMRAIHKYNVSGLLHAYNAQLLLGFLFLYNCLGFLRGDPFHRPEELLLQRLELFERESLEFVALHPLQVLP